VLAFDLWVLQTFSDVIDTRLSGRRTSLVAASDPATRAALASVPLPFTVGLGRISLTAQQVVELREGDVVRTGQPVDSDMIAAVDGVELFLVRLGQSNHRLTAEVLAPIAQSTSRTPARMGLS
jgi:flagellar motor switch protein FliM